LNSRLNLEFFFVKGVINLSLENISLGEVADITKLAGFEFTKYIEYLEHGEIIALRALNLRNGSLDLSDVKYISKEVSESLPRSKLYKNDILLTYTGNGYGDCAIVKENDKYHLAPNIAKITPKKINPYYLFEFINSKYFKKQMRNFIGGSSQPTIPMKTLRILEIPFPKEETQNKIAVILSNINKKIEINKEINKNLFNIASSIQTEWMINFTPFKSEKFKSSSFGLIPENWNVGKLGDVIELLDSKRIPLSGQQRENMEKIYPYYGAASLMDYVEDYIFDGVYLLMGEDGTVVDDKGFPILQYVWGKFWVNNHAHILKGKNGFNVESLYLLLSKTNIQSIVTGAVQAKVNQSNLKSIEIIIPPVEVMEKFNKLIKPFFDTIRSNNDEIKELQKLRDTLLPKLMSGEIDVSKINCDLD